MYYMKPSKVLKKYYQTKKDIDQFNNKEVVKNINVYANSVVDDYIINRGVPHKNLDSRQIKNDLKNINKPKIDNDYNRIITDKGTSNSVDFKVRVQRIANDQTNNISQAQYDRLMQNLDAVEKVLTKWDISIEYYKELNAKYPKTESRRGIITESIANKNLITAHGVNIQPHVFGYRELSPLTESMHRRAQMDAGRKLAQFQNEEARKKGQEEPNQWKTWVWTGRGKTTRHHSNDGKTVKFDDKFFIKNDADGHIDEMMYPLDPEVHSSNTGICYCEVHYHNEEPSEAIKEMSYTKPVEVVDDELHAEAKKYLELKEKGQNHRLEWEEIQTARKQADDIEKKFRDLGLDIKDFYDWDYVAQRMFKLAEITNKQPGNMIDSEILEMYKQIAGNYKQFPFRKYLSDEVKAKLKQEALLEIGMRNYKAMVRYGRLHNFTQSEFEDLIKLVEKTYPEECEKLRKEVDLDEFKEYYYYQYGGGRLGRYDAEECERKVKELEEKYPKETKKLKEEVHEMNPYLEVKGIDKLPTEDKEWYLRAKEIDIKDVEGENSRDYKKFQALTEIINNDDIVIKHHVKRDLPSEYGDSYTGLELEDYYIIRVKGLQTEIWVGENNGRTPPYSAGEIYKLVLDIPRTLLKNSPEILFSTSESVYSKHHKQYCGGWCNHDTGKIKVFLKKQYSKSHYEWMTGCISHELGHAMDRDLNDTSRRVYDSDKGRVEQMYYKIAEAEGGFVTSYARKGYDQFGTDYCEDFAESMELYQTNPQSLRNHYPERFKFIDALMHSPDFYDKVKNLKKGEIIPIPEIKNTDMALELLWYKNNFLRKYGGILSVPEMRKLLEIERKYPHDVLVMQGDVSKETWKVLSENDKNYYKNAKDFDNFKMLLDDGQISVKKVKINDEYRLSESGEYEYYEIKIDRIEYTVYVPTNMDIADIVNVVYDNHYDHIELSPSLTSDMPFQNKVFFETETVGFRGYRSFTDNVNATIVHIKDINVSTKNGKKQLKDILNAQSVYNLFNSQYANEIGLKEDYEDYLRSLGKFTDGESLDKSFVKDYLDYLDKGSEFADYAPELYYMFKGLAFDKYKYQLDQLEKSGSANVPDIREMPTEAQKILDNELDNMTKYNRKTYDKVKEAQRLADEIIELNVDYLIDKSLGKEPKSPLQEYIRIENEFKNLGLPHDVYYYLTESKLNDLKRKYNSQSDKLSDNQKSIIRNRIDSAESDMGGQRIDNFIERIKKADVDIDIKTGKPIEHKKTKTKDTDSTSSKTKTKSEESSKTKTKTKEPEVKKEPIKQKQTKFTEAEKLANRYVELVVAKAESKDPMRIAMEDNIDEQIANLRKEAENLGLENSLESYASVEKIDLEIRKENSNFIKSQVVLKDLDSLKKKVLRNRENVKKEQLKYKNKSSTELDIGVLPPKQQEQYLRYKQKGKELTDIDYDKGKALEDLLKDKTVVITPEETYNHRAEMPKEYQNIHNEKYTVIEIEGISAPIYVGENYNGNTGEMYNIIKKVPKVLLEQAPSKIVFNSSECTKGGIPVGGVYIPESKTLVVYNTGLGDLDHTLTHELAHRLDYSSKVPISDKIWKLVYSIEGNYGGVTEYAQNYGYQEDFADSVALYYTNPKSLKKNYPLRYDIIDSLINNKEYLKYAQTVKKGEYFKMPSKSTQELLDTLYVKHHNSGLALEEPNEAYLKEITKKKSPKVLDNLITTDSEKAYAKDTSKKEHGEYELPKNLKKSVEEVHNTESEGMSFITKKGKGYEKVGLSEALDSKDLTIVNNNSKSATSFNTTEVNFENNVTQVINVSDGNIVSIKLKDKTLFKPKEFDKNVKEYQKFANTVAMKEADWLQSHTDKKFNHKEYMDKRSSELVNEYIGEHLKSKDYGVEFSNSYNKDYKSSLDMRKELGINYPEIFDYKLKEEYLDRKAYTDIAPKEYNNYLERLDNAIIGGTQTTAEKSKKDITKKNADIHTLGESPKSLKKVEKIIKDIENKEEISSKRIQSLTDKEVAYLVDHFYDYDTEIQKAYDKGEDFKLDYSSFFSTDVKKLPKEAQEAIKTFTTKGFEAIRKTDGYDLEQIESYVVNEYIPEYEHNTGEKFTKEQKEELRDEIVNNIVKTQKNLDNNLSKGYLKKNMILCRGEIKPHILIDGSYDVSKIKEGAIGTLKGITSTSISTDVGENFNTGAFKLYLLAPEGTQGLYIEQVSANKKEKEFLLAKDTKVQVIRFDGENCIARIIPKSTTIKKIPKEKSDLAKKIYYLRNTLDMERLDANETHKANKEMVKHIKEFEKNGEKWQDYLTEKDIKEVNNKLSIPTSDNPKVWNEEQLKVNLVKAFENEVPKKLDTFDNPEPYQELEYESYIRDKYLYDAKKELKEKGIDWNSEFDSDVVENLTNHYSASAHEILQDINTIQYYKYAYDETKFLSKEKKDDWKYKVKNWKKKGIDIESLADSIPVSNTLKKLWDRDLEIYKHKIAQEKEKMKILEQNKQKIKDYEAKIIKNPTDTSNIKTNPDKIDANSFAKSLKNNKKLSKTQLELFKDLMEGGVGHRDLARVLKEDVGVIFQEAELNCKDGEWATLNKFGNKIFKRPDLDYEEIEGMQRYTGNDHTIIDRYYIAGEVPKTNYSPEEIKRLNKDINCMVEGLDKGSNDYAVILYKGSSEPWAVDVGEVGTFGKPQSTTIFAPATNYFGFHKTVIIAPPHKAKGVWVAEFSQHREEQEALLSPHNRYQTLYKSEDITVIKLL